MMRATVKAIIWLTLAALVVSVSGCSRERRDWRSAQGADSMEAYDRFLELHPESTLAPQARARLAQLTEERDWQRASTADTSDSYRQFLAQHPNGKWSQEARIRVENFSLEEQPLTERPEPVPTPRPRSSGAQTHPDPSEFATADAPRGEEAVPPVVTASAPTNDTVAPVSAGSEPAEQSNAASVPEYETSFGIQLGAFSSELKASEEWQRLAEQFNAELGSLTPHVVAALTTAGQQLYRLQAAVEDEDRARTICASLLEKSQGCVVVLPQH